CDRVSEQIGPTPDEGLGSARAQHIAVSRKGLDGQDQTAERQATEMLVGEEETGDGPRNSDGGACLGARLEHAKKVGFGESGGRVLSKIDGANDGPFAHEQEAPSAQVARARVSDG